MARYIKERRWAKEQIITDGPDGSVILEMKTSGWMDVKKWILSFGADAEVLVPTDMREEVLITLSEAAANYCSAIK